MRSGVGAAAFGGGVRGMLRPLRSFRAHWVRLVVAALVVAIGLAVSHGVARWVYLENERQYQAELADDGAIVAAQVQTASNRIETRLAAVAGLFRASDHVTAAEFDLFTSEIGLLPGMGGYGFAALVADEEFDRWQAEAMENDVDYGTFGIDSAGGRVEHSPAPFHAPILYFAQRVFAAAPEGLDLMSEPLRAATLETALRSGTLAVTPFLHLLSEPDPDGLVAFMPVRAQDGSTVGFITGPADLSLLLDAAIPQNLANRLVWRITDLQDRQTLGLAPSQAGLLWSGSVTFGNREWLLEVTYREPTLSAGPLPLPWVTVPVSIAGSLLCALLVLLLAAGLDARRERLRLQGIVEGKDKLLATVSHELRTPLTSVVGFLHEVLHRTDIGYAEERELLALASTQADELSCIVEDLLTAARASAGKELAVSVQATDLSQEIAAALRVFPHTVTVKLPVELCPVLVWADPGRLRQILRNLLDNAARHGRPPIGLTVATGSESIRVQVSDHGPGIPPELQHLIFLPHQALSDSPGLTQSFGLGLWIAHRLTKAMGGDLTYQAHPTPTFTLDLRPAAPVFAPATAPTHGNPAPVLLPL